MVEFEVHFKEEIVEGYMDLKDANDERPLQFYSNTGQLQWYIPPNPYENPVNLYEQMCKSAYEIIVHEIHANDIIQLLVDHADKFGTIIKLNEYNNDEVILIIN